MPALRILSGGAAQGLVHALAPQFERETGFTLEGEFGAVGLMQQKLRAGTPADLVILTAAIVADLAREGLAVAESARALGTVHTGVAVRSGDERPRVDEAADLRRALLQADEVYFPDPQQATAGIHFARVLASLGIADDVAARLRTFPNGATAMRELAASTATRPIGCTQVTEILNTPGVTLVGPLPPGCELATVYTAVVTTRAEHPRQAHALIALLAGEEARDARSRAGFA